MKLIHTGDLHIGMVNYSKLDPETGLETRLLDFFKTFDRIIDYAIEQNVDAFLFAGDAYKTRDPSPTQQRGFGERIKRLAKNGIPVILAVGNHDTPNAEGKANTLDIYSALEIDNVFVSRKPELLNIATKSGNLQVVTAPWLQKGDFKNLGDKLLSLYEKLNPSTSSGPNGPAVLLGHLEVEGSSFGSEKGLSISNDVTVPISLLTNKKLNYVALGHIHKFQELSKNPSIVYAGSPERIDFGEEKDEKGFVLVEIQESRAKSQDKKSSPSYQLPTTSYQFISSGAREFCTIKIDLKADDQNPTETILNEIKKHDIKDKIVRVVIFIPADLSKEIEMDQIKKALAEANHIAGISRNVERVNRQVLEGQDEVERLTPLEALQKYFELKKFTPEKIKNLETYASKLFDS